jgi:HPt (histidine-containing phosphotransfer) domain-containing protein
VDFDYLESFAAGDMTVVEEVLSLFREQAALWSVLLRHESDGLHDALHTIKGASRGVGAFALGEACAAAEVNTIPNLDPVHGALDAVLSDIAAYLHERALQSLKTPGGYSAGAESTPDAF